MTARYVAVLDEADRLEPRLARALLRSMAKIRARVAINDLAMALHAKDARAAERLLAIGPTRDALSPAATIVRDAVLHGGRVGAAQVGERR